LREKDLPGAELLALAIVHAAAPARILDAALRVASRLTHYRDPETRSHLERMAHYAQLIAHGLAAGERLSDEFLAFLLLFAPIHDIGKIAIPDTILLKRGPLSARELAVMRTHVTKGAEIVDGILFELGLKALPQAQMLRNVVLFHHEAVDGSGYPEGRRRGAIPLEARIVTVADVFDALTSERPYKAAWPAPEALSYLERRAGTKFDARCVEVLGEDLEQALEIRARFKDKAGELQSREGYTAEL
jgi:two-component system response regulator RpfG